MRAGGHGGIAPFVRMAFLDLTAYRARYVVGVLNYTIYMGVQYFLWKAVYGEAASGAEGLGGFRFRELITYFAVGWIVRAACFNNIDREMAERVRQGDIVLDLLRPVPLIAMRYGQAVGEATFRAIFMGVPTALAIFPLFGVEGPRFSGGPWGVAAGWAAFLASTLLAFHVFFLINFLVGACAVFFERIQGFLWAKATLVQFLSGLMVPFDLFPAWARDVLGALPFRAMAYGPGAIWAGKFSGGELAGELAIQAGWTLALWLLAQRLWSLARRRLEAQGG